MTAIEFAPIAQRIGRLWPSLDWTAVIVEEYHAVLERFTSHQVSRAIDLIARQPRPFRPDVGLIYETADAQPPSDRPALPAALVDPVSEAEHRLTLARLGVVQTAEHRRRHQGVVDLLRTTGYRIPLPDLWSMMPTSHCSAEEFDARLARHRGLAGVSRNSPPDG